MAVFYGQLDAVRDSWASVSEGRQDIDMCIRNPSHTQPS
jgi:hypothetical protein